MKLFTTIERDFPVNIIREDCYLFEKDLRINIPVPTVNKYKFCLFFENGIAYNWRLKVLENSLLLWHNNITKPNLFFLLKNLFRLKFKILPSGNRYILAHTRWSENYFHWMTDSLPRLLSAKEFTKDAIVLLPKLSNDAFFEDSLQILGIKGVFRLKENELYFSNNVVIPSFTAETGNYNPIIIHELSASLSQSLTKSDQSDNNTCGRIFISRQKASKRRIINEIEICSMLKKYDFRIVCFEDYSFQEQIKLCNNSTFMVSLHGAGLTNMMFMKRKSVVLELRNKGEANLNCYFALASAMDHRYYYLESNESVKNSHLNDISIDINKLESIILEIL